MTEPKTMLLSDNVRGDVINLLNDFEIKANEEETQLLENFADNEDSEGFNNTLDSIVKRTEIKTMYLMTKQGNFVVGQVAVNTTLDTPDFDFEQLEQRFNLIASDMPVNEIKEPSPYPLYTGSSLWTCNCKKDFIHSRFRHTCDKCGTEDKKGTNRTKMIQELF